MGQLLSILTKDESMCCSSAQRYEIFLDFENAQPSDEELQLFTIVQEVLEGSIEILNDIQTYKGAGKEIRAAITDPSDELQEIAWKAVVPLVKRLKTFYIFSTKLESVVPRLLGHLCNKDMKPNQHLENEQALVKQFAEILEFVLKFDEYKMKTPAIQNDFSYYRRALTRNQIEAYRSNEYYNDGESLIQPELANRISLFFAHATPMLKVLSEATSQFVNNNSDIPVEQITDLLSTMIKVCLRMLENPKLFGQFENEETYFLILRVMVGLIILYDHVHPNGAFVKSSQVDVKGCVRLIHNQTAERSEPLLNALKYTTKHLNEDSTPRSIRNLFQN